MLKNALLCFLFGLLHLPSKRWKMLISHRNRIGTGSRNVPFTQHAPSTFLKQFYHCSFILIDLFPPWFYGLMKESRSSHFGHVKTQNLLIIMPSRVKRSSVVKLCVVFILHYHFILCTKIDATWAALSGLFFKMFLMRVSAPKEHSIGYMPNFSLNFTTSDALGG